MLGDAVFHSRDKDLFIGVLRTTSELVECAYGEDAIKT